MIKKRNQNRILRWFLSVALVVTGLSMTWAWGQVARLAEPATARPVPSPETQFALWHPGGAGKAVLYRSVDGAVSWEPLVLPANAEPAIWASDGEDQLAVVDQDKHLVVSSDKGESWRVTPTELSILSLAWSEIGELYLGSDRQGAYRLAPHGSQTALEAVSPAGENGVELASLPILGLTTVGDRLFAATPDALFYTDTPISGGWNRSQPVPGGISALVALDRKSVFVGTETLGIFRSADAGQSWHPASEGLGLTAGQMVKISALRAGRPSGSSDMEDGLLYATVDHVLGSTQVHSSAAGAFVTVDGGASWQPLAGPSFPGARHATDLVLVAGRPLHTEVVTASGLQTYGPDVTGALAALKSDNAKERANGARHLGLALADVGTSALVSALADPEPLVSLAAADALGRINNPATVGGLLVALDYPEEHVRLGAARALGLMRAEAAVEPLRTMLIKGKGATVSVAAEALGRIGSRAAMDALLTALDSPAGTSRWHAALSALEAVGEPAVKPLDDMLSSTDPFARRNAAEALGWIGSPTATPALMSVLTDESVAVREQAAWALGEVGDLSARAALERVQARDPSVTVQVAAEAALTRIEPEPVLRASWLTRLAPALQRLQAVRWTLLALTLAAAVWLAGGHRGLILLAEPLQGRRHEGR
jgi:HEAT repeat protein